MEMLMIANYYILLINKYILLQLLVSCRCYICFKEFCPLNHFYLFVYFLRFDEIENIKFYLIIVFFCQFVKTTRNDEIRITAINQSTKRVLSINHKANLIVKALKIL